MNSCNYANVFNQYGRLTILPNRGKLYVVSDFHARCSDFNDWLSETGVVDSMQDGEDIYVYLNGDMVDIKSNDKFAQKNGDTKIVRKIREIQRLDNGDRFIYGMGTHEWWSSNIYLKSLLPQCDISSNRGLKKDILSFMHASEYGDEIKQFNFIDRMDFKIAKYLNQLPITLLTKNGLVVTHAGPSKSAISPKSIESPEINVVQELIWGRPSAPDTKGKIYPGDYTEQDISEFLKRMNNSKVLINGHTPVNLILQELLIGKLDVARFGEQIIHSTSHGSINPDAGTYVVVDLAKQLTSVSDLKQGKNFKIMAYYH